MIEQVEISSLDLRFEGYRLKNKRAEMVLLASILENGIKDPLQGVDSEESRILLDGFKRYRCARKLNIGLVPYHSLAGDTAGGIIELLRVSEAKPLSILEQAKLVEALQGAYRLSTAEIAQLLDKSKAWVSVRSGMIREISPTVMNRVFSGQFPVYAFMYILRPFMRINGVKTKEIDEFVDLVSGKNLSIRDLKLLADGYFKGSDEYRRQIKKGAISWVLSSLKETSPRADAVSSSEQALIKDLELTLKYMERINLGSKKDGYKSNDFLAQANLLAGAILRQMDIFKEAIKKIHDKSGKT
jgi:hypothetical protein